MSQVLLDDLARDVVDRLQRRAVAAGRSLSDEIRSVLSEVPEPAPAHRPNVSIVDVIGAIVRDAGITEKDWQYFDRSLRDVREARYDSIHREPLFGDWFDDFEDEDDDGEATPHA